MPFTEETKPRLPEGILVHAPLNFGKTVLAMTASAKFPSLPDWDKRMKLIEDPIKRETVPVIHFDDVFHIGIDTDAVVGFPSLRISVPSYDMSHAKGEAILQELDKALKMCNERVKAGKTKILVIDTVSTFNLKLIAWARSMFERNANNDDSKSRDNNSRILYRFVLGGHTELIDNATGIDCMKIWLAHSTTKGGESDKHNSPADHDRDVKFEVQGLIVGEANIVAAITGQAWDHYHRNISIVCNISKTSKFNYVNGQNVEEVNRMIHPREVNKAFNRTRFHMLSRDEQPHFGMMFKKILGG